MVSLTDRLISAKFITCLSQLFLTVVVAYTRRKNLDSNYEDNSND